MEAVVAPAVGKERAQMSLGFVIDEQDTDVANDTGDDVEEEEAAAMMTV